MMGGGVVWIEVEVGVEVGFVYGVVVCVVVGVELVVVGLGVGVYVGGGQVVVYCFQLGCFGWIGMFGGFYQVVVVLFWVFVQIVDYIFEIIGVVYFQYWVGVQVYVVGQVGVVGVVCGVGLDCVVFYCQWIGFVQLCGGGIGIGKVGVVVQYCLYYCGEEWWL